VATQTPKSSTTGRLLRGSGEWSFHFQLFKGSKGEFFTSFHLFLAQYLGSTLVRHVRGTESTKRSIQKLKKKKAEEAGKRTTSIVLAISLSGVQFLDPFNQVL
jgi:hypothetical protein